MWIVFNSKGEYCGRYKSKDIADGVVSCNVGYYAEYMEESKENEE